MARHCMSRLATASIFAVALFSACSPDHLVIPRGAGSALRSTIPTADPNATNNPGFHWLPPIGASGKAAAPFDASLLSRISVVVCEWDGSACGATAATISAGSEQGIALDGGHYQANLDARKYLASGHVYRARVFVIATEIGHVDLQVVDNGSRAGAVAAPRVA